MADLFIDPELRPASYYRPQRYNAGSAFGKFVLLGVILLVVGGGVTYFLLKRTVVLNTTVPTVLAEAGAIKERPSDPGGIAVQHQDTTVYDRLEKAEGRGKVEQLLPVAEKPDAALLAETSAAKAQAALVPVEKPAPNTSNTDTPVKPVESAPQKSVEKPAPKPAILTAREEMPKPEKPAVAAPPPEPKTITAVPEPKKIQPPPEAKAAPVPQPFKTPEQMAALAKPKPIAATEEPTAAPPVDVAQILARSGIGQDAATAPSPGVTPTSLPAAPAKGLSRVQLASSPDQEAAEKKMLTMVSQHATLLRNTRLTTVRADLGAKGIYYRIQTQAMPTAEASQLCGRLKAARVECLIVKAAAP